MPDFEYLTIKQLRDEDITVVELPDARAKQLIKYYSSRINTLTNQWFQPNRLRTRVDGRNCALAHLPNFIPILVLDKLQVGVPDGQEFDVQSDSYVLQPNSNPLVLPRVVELIGPSVGGGVPLVLRVPFLVQEGGVRNGFPRTPQAVVLDGVFGWIEDKKAVTTDVIGLLTAPAGSPATVEIPVLSTAGFRRGDTLVFPGNYVAILRDILTTPNRLVIEEPDFTISMADKIEDFGRVPLQIQRAMMLLINRFMSLISVETTAEATMEALIKSESVEGYSYSRDSLTPEQEKKLGGPGSGDRKSVV